MKLVNQISIPAPQQKVWDALNTPDVLQACIEGCTRLELLPDGSFAGTVQANIGPVRATFQGIVRISDVQAPSHYILSGEGKGGVAGFAKGSATIDLTPLSENDTLLSYQAEALVGGKLAQLGGRLIESTARDYADKFFTKFQATLAAPGMAVSPADGAPVADTTYTTPVLAAAAPASQTPSGLQAWLWAPIVVALLAGMAWYAATRL
jgi:carbon monoxide dehydrogenase subunit G